MDQLFPAWMAPNLITLSGLMFILFNLLTTFYVNPTMDANQPAWCYVSYAIGLFLYQIFDGVDGIHARRTGQSGPLGELFDHCIDALNTTLSVIVFASTAKVGYSWLLILYQFATLTNFYLSTWEEYHTHVLFLSQFSGPVEGILMIVALFLLTAVLGGNVWTKPLFQLDLTSVGIDFSCSVNPVPIYVVLGGAGLLMNIESARQNVLKKVEAKGRLKGLIPFFAFYASVALTLLLHPEIITTHCLAFVLTIGLTIAFTVGRIILAHLTLQPFPYLNPPMLIPLGQLALIWISTHVYGFHYETVVGNVVWTGLGLSLGLHGMFVTEIIYEITTYLDIYALSIKHKKTE